MSAYAGGSENLKDLKAYAGSSKNLKDLKDQSTKAPPKHRESTYEADFCHDPMHRERDPKGSMALLCWELEEPKGPKGPAGLKDCAPKSLGQPK